jgi:hypothetical protein
VSAIVGGEAWRDQQSKGLSEEALRGLSKSHTCWLVRAVRDYRERGFGVRNKSSTHLLLDLSENLTLARKPYGARASTTRGSSLARRR